MSEKIPQEFEIKIISHMPYSEYRYDIAYGRAKRFLKNKNDKNKTLPFNDFALLINKVYGGIQVRILPRNENLKNKGE